VNPELHDVLYEFLCHEYGLHRERMGGQIVTGRVEWQMNPDWWADVKMVTDPSGCPVWGPCGLNTEYFIFGYPVSIKPEYGLPRLGALEMGLVL
jgi:hypothetical protein